MSSVYNPNGTLVSPTSGAGNPVSIASSTNTAPIQVTFTSPTSWNDQDTIEIEGHTGNSGALGQWVATKITSSVWSLNGSTGTGTGGATGYGTDYSLTPAATIPGDGDLASSANLMTPVEGALNLGPALYRLVGKYRLYGAYYGGHIDDTNVTTAWATAAPSSSTFVNLTGATALLSLGSPAPVVLSTDALDITVDGSCKVSSVISGTSTIALAISINVAGAGNFIIPGSSRFFDSALDAITNPAFSRMSTRVVFGGVSGTFQIGLMAAGVLQAGAVATSIGMFGSCSVVVRQYRPN